MINEQSNQPVSVLGLGLMGTALADAFVRAGHRTTVWTRSPDKPGPEGGHRVATAADAVGASPLVVVCVLDYDAVDGVLPADLTGRTVVNLSTGSPEQGRSMAARVATNGGRYLDGGIMATPPGIGKPESMILYSGSGTAFEEFASALAVLARPEYLGEDPGLAALHDTALLGMMYSTVVGFLQATALVNRDGVPARQFLPLALDWLTGVATFLPAMAEQVDTGDYRGGEATLAMQVSAIDHIVHAGQSRAVDTTIMEHVRDLVGTAVEAGHGLDDLGALVEVLRK